MQQHDVKRKDDQEYGELCRDNASQVTLSQKEKPRRESAVVDRRLRDSFGDPTKQRERAKRHDERRDSEVRDEHGVERAAGAANEQRDERRERGMEPPVAARGAKDHRRESHHRPDRQIDSAGDDDRRERDGQQPELNAQARDFEEVPGGREVRRDCRKERDLDRQRDEQDGVPGPESIERPDHGAGDTTSSRHCQKPLTAESAEIAEPYFFFSAASAFSAVKGSWQVRGIDFNALTPRQEQRPCASPVDPAARRRRRRQE